MQLFFVVEYLHILSAILAVGANVTYGFWISQASKKPETLPFTLNGIKAIDSRVANPAYGMLLVTGLMMAFLKPYPLTTPWLLTAMILYALVAVMGILVYAPVTRRQRKVLEEEGFESASYTNLASRARTIGLTVSVLVLVILYLMVFKPALWGEPTTDISLIILFLTT